jgi:hypothetical protein
MWLWPEWPGEGTATLENHRAKTNTSLCSPCQDVPILSLFALQYTLGYASAARRRFFDNISNWRSALIAFSNEPKQPEMRQKKPFDCLMTALSNWGSAFVFSKSAIGGGGSEKIAKIAGTAKSGHLGRRKKRKTVAEPNIPGSDRGPSPRSG